MWNSKAISRFLTLSGLTVALLIAGWYSWPWYQKWQQQQVANGLLEFAVENESANSRTMLRQLARLDPPAIEQLVRGVQSENGQLSEFARKLLDEKLAIWKARGKSDPQFPLGKRLASLAAVLEKQVDHFSLESQLWAEKTTLEIIDLSAQLQADESIHLVQVCERILTAVQFLENTSTSSTESQTATDDKESSGALPLIDSAEAIPKGPSGIEFTETDSPAVGYIPSGGMGATPNTSILASPPGESNNSPDTTHLDEQHHSRETEVKMNELQPLHAREVDSSARPLVVDIPSPKEMDRMKVELQGSSLRTVLERLTTADQYEKAIIRSVLKERGLSQRELALTDKLIAKEPQERLQLIDDLRVLPARVARRWLRELLKDPHPHVRLQALTALATTSDPELYQITRELILQDSDPEVAELASRILRELR